MPTLVIQIRDHRTAFSPRESLAGEVSWQLDSPPRSAEVRLLWTTFGRGIEDIGLVETIPFPNPQIGETRPFTFKLPEGPYSFSGSLITLTWVLELFIQPGDLSRKIEFTMAPEGKAIALPRVNPSATSDPMLR